MDRDFVVLLLRHCEDGRTYRQPDKSRHCNPLGWQRAHYLAMVLFGQRWPLPTHLYALMKSQNMRQYETLLPVSQRTGVNITGIDFHNQPTVTLVNAVQHDLREMCNTDTTVDAIQNNNLNSRMIPTTPMITVVVVAWKHVYLPDVAAALGCDHCPHTWDDDDFDSVWQLHYHYDNDDVTTNSGPTVYASVVHQHFDPLAVQWQHRSDHYPSLSTPPPPQNNNGGTTRTRGIMETTKM
jgi:hypothetical protein